MDSYPNPRAILLMQTLIKDLNTQLLKILSNFQVMLLDYQEFEILKRDISSVFQLLFEKIQEFRTNINNNRSRLDVTQTEQWKSSCKIP